MKKIITCCGLLFLCWLVHGQSVIIKGKIKCVQNTNSTKGAENVVVVPAFIPSKSTATLTRPSGYFEFNTGLPINILQDKVVSVYVISSCTSCKEIVKHVFISEDQDRQNKNDNKQYVTMQDWLLNANCDKATLKPLAVDSVLNVVAKQPGHRNNYINLTNAHGNP